MTQNITHRARNEPKTRERTEIEHCRADNIRDVMNRIKEASGRTGGVWVSCSAAGLHLTSSLQLMRAVTHRPTNLKEASHNPLAKHKQEPLQKVTYSLKGGCPKVKYQNLWNLDKGSIDCGP